MNITFEEAYVYIPQNIRETMTIHEFDLLVDNANSVMYELEMDGYRYEYHYTIESIMNDLLPDFIEDLEIKVNN